MISCIVAVERGHGIGFNNSMPWPRLPGDMKWFKEKTTNNVIIMGSKTWQSLQSTKLSNRVNVVVSRSAEDLGADHQFIDTDLALDICTSRYPDKEIFIIGGSAIYEAYLDIIDRFYITEINSDYKCDKFFDLNYVKKHFTNVTEHHVFFEPVPYKIKEYNQ